VTLASATHYGTVIGATSHTKPATSSVRTAIAQPMSTNAPPVSPDTSKTSPQGYVSYVTRAVKRATVQLTATAQHVMMDGSLIPATHVRHATSTA